MEKVKLQQERYKLEQERERRKCLELRSRGSLPPLALPGPRSHSTSSVASTPLKLPSISSNQSISNKSSGSGSNPSPSVRQQKRIVNFKRFYGTRPPTDEQTSKYERKLSKLLQGTNWALRFSTKSVSVVRNAGDKDVSVFDVDVSKSAWEWKRQYFFWKDAVLLTSASAFATDEAQNSAILDRYKNSSVSDGSSARTSIDSQSAPARERASLVSLT